MIDQMPDEVWLRRIGTWVQQPEGEHRYIRADLYDSKACPHVVGETTQHCALAEDEVRRLTQRAEQAEAERDRLRAALERIVDIDTDWRMGVAENMGRCRELAEEALRDD